MKDEEDWSIFKNKKTLKMRQDWGGKSHLPKDLGKGQRNIFYKTCFQCQSTMEYK